MLNKIATIDNAYLKGVTGVAADSDYVYCICAGSTKLVIIDVIDKENPAIKSTLEDATKFAGAYNLVKSGDYLYIAGQTNNYLTIVNISDPANPSITGSLQDATNLKGAYDVAVEGDYAYVVCKGTGYYFTVVDISSKSSPSYVGKVACGGLPAGVAVDGDYAYILVSYNVINVKSIDITTKATPTVSSTLTIGSTSYYSNRSRLVKIGDFLFFGRRYGVAATDYIQVIDAFDPTSLGNVGSYSEGDYVYIDAIIGVTVGDDGYLYVITENGDIMRFDVKGYLSIINTYKETYIDNPRGIFIDGDYAYITSYDLDRLSIYNISDPTSLSLVGSVQDTTNLNGAIFVYVVGDYAFVTSELSDRVTVVDVSDKSAPTVSGSLTHAYLNEAKDVFVNSNGTFGAVTAKRVSYTDGYFCIIDFLDKTSPLMVRSFTDNNPTSAPSQRGAIRVKGDDDLLFMSAYQYGTIWSFSYEGLDAFKKGVTNAALSGVTDIDITGNYVVAVKSNYLYIFDVSDITNITLVGTLNNSNISTNPTVRISGDYAYTSSAAGDRVTIINISTKSSPSFVGTYYSTTYADWATKSKKYGDYLYFGACNKDTFTILDISDKTTPAYEGSYASSTYLDAINDIDGDGDYGYATANGAGGKRFTIIDLSDKASPAYKSSVTDATYLASPAGLVVDGNYAYVVSTDYFVVIDISNKNSPSIVATINDDEITSAIGKVKKSGNYVYFETGSYICFKIDVSTPATPSIAGKIYHESRISNGLAIGGTYAFFAHSTGQRLSPLTLSDFNVADGTPIRLGSFTDATDLVNPAGLFFEDDRLYVSGNGKFLILDISDPTSISKVSVISDSKFFYGTLFKSGDKVYVTSTGATGHAVVEVDVSNEDTPVITAYVISTFSFYNNSDGFLKNGYFFMTNTGDKLSVVKVSDLSGNKSPSILEWLADVDFVTAKGICSNGYYAYMSVDVAATDDDRIAIIQIGSAPAPVSTFKPIVMVI